MKFCLIDQISEIHRGERISAVKCLSLAEEYLQDHFPRFPVMPGVLMLEAMTQTGAWLVRVTNNFSHSLTVLKEARNVKYGNFVEPGEILIVKAELVKMEGNLASLKVSGEVNGSVAVSSRIVLESYNSSGTDQPNTTDQCAIRQLKQQYDLLCRQKSSV
ncbi:3-hydroxyacyl-ACP dehydratase FabZ family protein [Blastopirellula marina]|uniref:Beta-hydroxyacyl-ACP dehydratase n=1 Tax=Blastopirellula marina TaxID=124 RepID=A0A2S8F4E1_9BACT|nr:3-hydroxyacyl-ACP dehydratase FabZ family protein [Blastopirellula marina]PQO27032.1 beta-hydroxyacyl-ACP dehydratase [Blastopirellula marina]PTL41179.1 beta-hydroxyacyl-ACP dehydratase [Blastopirellula marina]